MFRMTLLRTAVAGAALCGAVAANATLTVYTDLASWTAAVTGVSVDTFNDLPGSATSSPLVRTVGSYGYTATAAGNFFPAGTAGDRWLSTNIATSPIIFGTFTGGVEAIAGFFFNSDINGVLQTGRGITVAATDGDDSESMLLTNTTPTTFLGFVSDGLISSLTVTANNLAGTTATWPTINDLRLAQVGDGPPNPTPEPGTMALLGVAAMGLVAARRRKA